MLQERVPGGEDELWTVGSYLDADSRPLAVFTGVSEDELLADWLAAAMLTIAQLFVLLAVAVVLLWTIARQIGRLTDSGFCGPSRDPT